MSPPAITLDQFRAEMLGNGYQEVLERPWAPDTVVGSHSHPFEASAVVVQGEMWLAVEGDPAQHLRPGDRFHLQPNVMHTERYGSEGATFWVARRNAVARPHAPLIG
jgi:hypothetical protein